MLSSVENVQSHLLKGNIYTMNNDDYIKQQYMEGKLCERQDCKAKNPIHANYCRICGSKFSTDMNELPFHLRRPELNLVPYSAFWQKPCNTDLVLFWDMFSLYSGDPEYVENLQYSGDTVYLYAAKHDRVGIISWSKKNTTFRGLINKYTLIVPYKYEMIEKRPGMFVCHKKNGKTDYRDMQGEILR